MSGDPGWLVHPRARRCGAWFAVVSSHPIDLPQNSMSSCGGNNNPGVPDAQGATPSSERESLAKNALGHRHRPLIGCREVERGVKFGAAVFITDEGVGPQRLGAAVEVRGFDSLVVTEHSHIPVAYEEDHWGVGNLFKMMVQLGAVTLNIEGIEGRHD
jgi:hypothetical protein